MLTGLGGKLLARSLATSGLAGSLLGASHCCDDVAMKKVVVVDEMLWWRCGL
jgi:hypothetical protein